MTVSFLGPMILYKIQWMNACLEVRVFDSQEILLAKVNVRSTSCVNNMFQNVYNHLKLKPSSSSPITPLST